MASGRGAATVRSPAHDDLVRRRVTADSPNWPRVGGATEHHTNERTLYLCATQDVFSNTVVRRSIDLWTKASCVVNALSMAVTHRGNPRCVLVHSNRRS